MALSYKSRRRLSLAILIIGLPIYIVVAVSILNMLGRPGVWVELIIYAALGIVWALPLKSVFAGVGQEDQDSDRDEGG